jgi:hypothetical protein
VIGHPQAKTVSLIPLPTIPLIRFLNDRNVDCSTVLLLKPNG